MKIDNITINVLKNFSKINNSIIISEGNELKIISPSKSILAITKTSIVFNKRFAIYDLNKFLSILNLFKEPDIIFEDTYLTISDNNKSTRFTYADESVITKVPNVKFPVSDITFTLTNDNLKDIEKAASVLQVPDIVFHGDGNDIYIRAENTENPSTDIYSIKIGNTDKVFNVVFKVENFKIIPDDYEVQVSSKGISRFIGNLAEYYISIQKNSTFE